LSGSEAAHPDTEPAARIQIGSWRSTTPEAELASVWVGAQARSDSRTG